MIFFLYFLIIKADEFCDKRTSIYNSHGYFNINSYYFDSNTYTENIISMTPIAYENHIKSTMACVGIWCVDDQWKCDNLKNCYTGEYIIPNHYIILEIYGCSVNVQGNLIMSYNKWNQELVKDYYEERTSVYGLSIFRSAYRSIYKACHNSTPTTYPEELCNKNNINKYFLLVLKIILIVTPIIIGILFYLYYQNEIDQIIYNNTKFISLKFYNF